MASKSTKGEILAKFFDDGKYTALFADGAVSAASGYAAGQQAYAVFQNGEAVSVKDVEKNIKVLELAAQTGCPVVTFYDSVGAKLAEGLDVLNAAAKLNAAIAKVSGVVPQVAVVLGVCGGTSALSAANADVCIMTEGAELFFTAPSPLPPRATRSLTPVLPPLPQRQAWLPSWPLTLPRLLRRLPTSWVCCLPTT